MSAEIPRQFSEYPHLDKRDSKTIRVYIATPFQEILGGFGSIQHDDNLPQNMERQDVPYSTC
jgi:hypothetical protein